MSHTEAFFLVAVVAISSAVLSHALTRYTIEQRLRVLLRASDEEMVQLRGH